MDTQLGRPTKYTEELGQEILERIALGESYASIASDEHMPARSTLLKWVAGTVKSIPQSFRDSFSRAQRELAHNLLGQVLEIADDGTNDTVIRESKNGTQYETFNHEWYQRSRLRIETRKYLIDRYLGLSKGEAEKDEEEAKRRYVDAAPQSESYEEWKQRRG